jgi:hypothetical protein
MSLSRGESGAVLDAQVHGRGLDEYRGHMKLHEMKTDISVVRTLLVTSAGVVEDLLKLRWERAADRVFSLRERRVRLLEAKRSAPGRELAHLIETQRRF